ncbi:amidohydrolase family protein [Photobacterium aphoticum]|uniref:Amidohydrolase 3 domain-containing protein n=1 Tax=Photobacterium aphoticum TaxID=754436 RepID=A0A0J1JC26_9GAMM|nr:amidohydrolase family protein [Photobacterium aphoticum]KLU99151.1 hypothetical protein ABT58_19265 [Photobacterium aphoticum]GHA45196.1 hypothetical protein GCM10007086_18420 [Photobacterium aphoticum]
MLYRLFGIWIGLTLLFAAGCDQFEDTVAADTIYINGHILTMSNPTHVRAMSIKDGKVQAVGTRAGVLRHKGEQTRVIDLQGKTVVPGWYAVDSDFMQVVNRVGLEQAQYLFAQAGYTTVVEQQASIAMLEQLRTAADGNQLSLDVIALVPFATFHSTLSQQNLPLPFRKTSAPQAQAPPSKATTPAASNATVTGSLTLAGVTLAVDGNMENQTAWMAIPYATQPPDRPPRWQGQPAMPYSEFRHAYQLAIEQAVQLFIHAMGDAAIDAVIQASDDLAITVEQQRRSVILSSRYARIGQLDQYKRLGLLPCFDTLHIVKHGDSDITWLGQLRAETQSPLRSATTRHLTFANQCAPLIRPVNDGPITATQSPETSESTDTRLTDEAITSRETSDNSQAVVSHDETGSSQETETTAQSLADDAETEPKRALPTSSQTESSQAENAQLKHSQQESSQPTPSQTATASVPNAMLSVWSAVNRMTAQKTLLGETERISALDALQALSRHAAYLFFEEKYKGRLVPGMQADMVILSTNPLSLPAGALREVTVIETLKAGRPLYPTPQGTAPADIKHIPTAPYLYDHQVSP